MRVAPSCAELLFEFLHQPGFANPRLAAQQHHLACARFGLLPALLQQPEFFALGPPTASSPFAPPPQSGSAPRSLRRLDTPERGGDAFEHLGPQVLALKQALHQPIGCRR